MASSVLIFLLLAALASRDAAHGEKLTHLHLYVHEIATGPNATGVAVAYSPIKDSQFGGLGVLDDMLKAGTDPASRLLGRLQGLVVEAGLQGLEFSTLFNFVFTDGDYNGSTITIVGRSIPGATVERSIVGGTGKFRMARGYSLIKVLDIPRPKGLDIYQVDLYVATHRGY